MVIEPLGSRLFLLSPKEAAQRHLYFQVVLCGDDSGGLRGKRTLGPLYCPVRMSPSHAQPPLSGTMPHKFLEMLMFNNLFYMK